MGWGETSAEDHFFFSFPKGPPHGWSLAFFFPVLAVLQRL